MSTLSHRRTAILLDPLGRRVVARGHQSSSWAMRLLLCLDRARQRDALRALVDNKHLLDDIGLSRREALDEVERPFWQ